MKTSIVLQFFLLIIFLPFVGKAQLVTISGNIVNGKTGESLMSVNIFESSTSIGTISNENGFFKLMLKQGDCDIKVLENGFKDYIKHFILLSDTTVTIKLKPVRQNKKRVIKQNNLQVSSKETKKNFGRMYRPASN